MHLCAPCSHVTESILLLCYVATVDIQCKRHARLDSSDKSLATLLSDFHTCLDASDPPMENNKASREGPEPTFSSFFSILILGSSVAAVRTLSMESSVPQSSTNIISISLRVWFRSDSMHRKIPGPGFQTGTMTDALILLVFSIVFGVCFMKVPIDLHLQIVLIRDVVRSVHP